MGIYFQDADNVQAFGNALTDVAVGLQDWAMNQNVSGAAFYNNLITDVDDSHGDGEAIEFTGNNGTYGNDGVYSSTGSAYGNFIQGSSTAKGGIDGWEANNCAVYDNIMTGNYQSADFQWTSSTGAAFYNNTIYGNNSNDAIEIYTNSSATIDNNIISTIRGRGIADSNESSVTLTENYNDIFSSVTTVRSTSITPGANDVYTNPLFVSGSPSAPLDFRLQAGSPDIRTGLVLSSPYNMVLDPLATSFPIYTMNQASYGGGADIGAFGFTQPFWTSSGNYSVSETASYVVITIVRSNGSDGTASVNYATSDGTAKAGQQYTATQGTLTFAPGVTSMQFDMPILDNGTGTFNITLSDPTGGTFLGTRSTAVVTITT